MDLLALTEYLVRSIVKDPEMASFRQIEDDEFITIEVLVNKDVMGSVIGKQGNIINAMRTIVQASSYANNLKKVKINVDAF